MIERRFYRWFLACCFACCFCVTAFAAGDSGVLDPDYESQAFGPVPPVSELPSLPVEPDNGGDSDVVGPPPPVPETENLPDTKLGSVGSPLQVEIVPSGVSEPSEPSGSDVSVPSVMALNPVKPTDASGLKKALLEVLGNYDAVVVTHSDSHDRYYTVQPDYPWLCGAGILALFILCLFKLLGVILCKR